MLISVKTYKLLLTESSVMTAESSGTCYYARLYRSVKHAFTSRAPTAFHEVVLHVDEGPQ